MFVGGFRHRIREVASKEGRGHTQASAGWFLWATDGSIDLQLQSIHSYMVMQLTDFPTVHPPSARMAVRADSCIHVIQWYFHAIYYGANSVRQ